MKLFSQAFLVASAASLFLTHAAFAQYNNYNIPNSITIPIPNSTPPAYQQNPSFQPPVNPQSTPSPSYTFQPPASSNVNQNLSGVQNRLDRLEQLLNVIQQQQTQIQQQQFQLNQRMQHVENSTNWYVQPAPGQPSPQDINPFQLHMAP